MKEKKLDAVRRLEEELKSADPVKSGKLAAKLVRLKEEWLDR